MISIADLLGYFPTQHGEHGVDSTLHMLAERQTSLHEVFSNTPGGSWTQFDILRPSANEIYRWDHMPRIPEAKRPDWVLQYNDGRIINFLVAESKEKFDDIYEDMGKLLIQFFTQSRGFLGIRNRPAWHKQRLRDDRAIDEANWELIPPTADPEIRFWFKDYDDRQLRFWPTFEFALEPEYYRDLAALGKDSVIRKMEGLLSRRTDIDVVIGVGWTGNFHTPFLLRSYSERFKTTKFASELDVLLRPSMLK